MGLVSSLGEAAGSVHLAVALPVAAVSLGLVYFISHLVYNVFFHPLRKFPGPASWGMTYIPYVNLQLSGEGHTRMLAMHKKYGQVIRVGPNTLAYSHPAAYRDILGHRKGGKLENSKGKIFVEQDVENIIGGNREDHARYRKSMANSFSHQAMLDQQSIIQTYVDKLFDRLEWASQDGKKVDVVSWFNFATFDIIGDLAFGETFGCLDDGTYHPWVSITFDTVKNVMFMTVFKRFPRIFYYIMAFILAPKGLMDTLREHRHMSTAKVQRRLALETDRPDFMSAMTSRKGSDALSFEELVSNASILVIAGSETTATVLSAAVFFLGSHPEVMDKLNKEVRSAFSREEEIDLVSVSRLEYMLAVIDETMRCQPAVAGPQPRTINEQGDTIIGEYVPPSTDVEIWHWAINHDPANWHRPNDFIPERWLSDKRFENDRKEGFNPFSAGPRSCIGKNLAYAEMRLMLARLVWRYNIELAEDSKNWNTECKVYVLYQKGPVNVYLTPRKT